MAVYATYRFLVDWTGSGLFDGPHDDITDRVMDGASWGTGRDFPSSQTGKSIAGPCTLKLKNWDGRFNSFNAASPLYGNMLPGRAVKALMTVGVTTATKYYGFLATIQPEPRAGGVHTATLQALGPLSFIAARKVSVEMQTSLAAGPAITAVLDEIGWPAADRDLDAGQTTMLRWWTGGKVDALNALKDLEDTDLGFLRESQDGKLVFEDRHHRLKGAHLTSQATHSDAVGAVLPYTDIEQGDPLKEIFNVVTAQVRIFGVDVEGLLWALQESGAEVRKIGPGDSRTWWAVCPHPLADSQVVAVSVWTTPVATTDYLANSSSDGLGTNHTADITVAVSKFDTSMKITLTNGAAVDVYITFLQARGLPVIEQIPIQIEDEDDPSQAKYGQRTYPVPAKFLPSTTSADDYVGFVLSTKKDAHPILTISYHATRTNATLLEALNRDVSDRITIVANGNSDLGISQDFFVESIAHALSGKVHMVTMQCSPCAPISDFWVLGVGMLGSSTILAY